jgi:hypothetical protein
MVLIFHHFLTLLTVLATSPSPLFFYSLHKLTVTSTQVAEKMDQIDFYSPQKCDFFTEGAILRSPPRRYDDARKIVPR